MGFRAPDADASHLPYVISQAWKAPTSGGSTGRPKLIVSGDPAAFDETLPPPLMMDPGGCLVMPGPLYHNGPAVWSCQALLNGLQVALLPRFDASETLEEIQKHRGSVLYMVPTMMKRILRLPDEERLSFDLSSLRVVWHLAEPCPEWLKLAWIEWLGAERIFELYAGTEAQIATVITGPEWMAHRGSVGKVIPGTVSITDEDGNEVPVGEMGEVWMRSPRATPTYKYLGATARTRDGGWESLGDMGRLDEDGYLYLGDRAADMILSGGANIYPAEIESVIQEHPAVKSCAVIGLPDEDKGSTVHAIVEADIAEVSEEELKLFLGERLVIYKVPRTFEFVDFALRDDAGKVRRSALRAERLENKS
jgi:bile acid-coenzyme A ligase